METLDHLGEVLFDDKCHYALHSYNDIYKLILPDHAIFQTKDDQIHKTSLIGLKVLKTRYKKKHGLLLYTDEDERSLCIDHRGPYQQQVQSIRHNNNQIGIIITSNHLESSVNTNRERRKPITIETNIVLNISNRNEDGT